MIRFVHFLILLFMFNLLGGCDDGGGVVATQDEMKAHAEKYGDLGLDPAASTDLID